MLSVKEKSELASLAPSAQPELDFFAEWE